MEWSALWRGLGAVPVWLEPPPKHRDGQNPASCSSWNLSPSPRPPPHPRFPLLSPPAVVPVAAAVTADETEALKAEITKAVKQVQEAGGDGEGKGVGPFLPHHPTLIPPLSPNPFTDPNTQILYACDSCGEKFLDATSLAQHVRIHTAQALVMFQADTDFYQQYGAAAAWQTEQVIPAGELLFRTRDGPPEPPAAAAAPALTPAPTAGEAQPPPE